jgi:hypothetical protein
MNKSTDIREPSYKRFSFGGHPNRMPFFFIPLAVSITTWRAPELP